jgi:Ca-activated chloride channel family protein
LIESELDEEMLTRIAEATGAAYFRATETAGLRQIYEAINRSEKSEVEVEIFIRYTELSAWVLLPAIVLLLLELLLRHTVFRTLP